MSTFISSVIPHQWRHAEKLIKTKKYTQVETHRQRVGVFEKLRGN